MLVGISSSKNELLKVIGAIVLGDKLSPSLKDRILRKTCLKFHDNVTFNEWRVRFNEQKIPRGSKVSGKCFMASTYTI